MYGRPGSARTCVEKVFVALVLPLYEPQPNGELADSEGEGEGMGVVEASLHPVLCGQLHP